MLYINDLPELTKCDAFLFADDNKTFRTITDKNYQDILQHDLNILEQWSYKWLLKFHPDKCKHMTTGKNNTRLSFDDNINQVVNTATKMTKIICRMFQFLDKDTFVPLYKTMVRNGKKTLLQ